MQGGTAEEIGTIPATFSLLQFETASNDLAVAGVLLFDPSSRRLHVRLRRDWERVARDEDVEVLELLEDQLERMAMPDDLGAEALLEFLEDKASHLLRVTDREEVAVEDFDRTLNRLYRRHVESNVVEFRTHIPLYSLRAAAGKFLANDIITAETWVEMPKHIRFTDRHFLARVVGHSMEPRIPDGSLCLFRFFGAGSRKSLPVLVENRQTTGDQRYTVKIYHSKAVGGEQGKSIFLEALNPAYESWYLDPSEDDFRIIAEFIEVIE